MKPNSLESFRLYFEYTEDYISYSSLIDRIKEKELLRAFIRKMSFTRAKILIGLLREARYGGKQLKEEVSNE